jgi:uncharacterized protein (DUF2336 family)
MSSKEEVRRALAAALMQTETIAREGGVSPARYATIVVTWGLISAAENNISTDAVIAAARELGKSFVTQKLATLRDLP